MVLLSGLAALSADWQAGRQGSCIVCASVQSCALVCRPCCCRSVASAWSVRIAVVIVTTSVLVKVINSMDERQSGVVLIKCKYLCTRNW